MTAASGQLEAGEVTAEQREAAHVTMEKFDRYCSCDEDNDPEALCDVIAHAIAAAERRGAEREREEGAREFDAAACMTCVHHLCISYRKAAALLRARGK